MNITPDARKLKAHLRDLSAAVTAHLAALDAEMKLPESKQRGRMIAKIANDLDLANDRALGVDYRTDTKSDRV